MSSNHQIKEIYMLMFVSYSWHNHINQHQVYFECDELELNGKHLKATEKHNKLDRSLMCFPVWNTFFLMLNFLSESYGTRLYTIKCSWEESYSLNQI